MQAGKNLISEQISISGDFPVYGGNGQRGFYSEYNYEGKRLLVGRQGALCGNVHRADGRFWATEHAIVTKNTHLCNIDFLYYLLISMNLNQYVSSTAAQPGLAVSTIQNICTCLPCITEQEKISAYLDKKIRCDILGVFLIAYYGKNGRINKTDIVLIYSFQGFPIPRAHAVHALIEFRISQ